MALGTQVADHIVELIATQALPEGSRLPSEAQLGDAIGVSRLTVRESLKVLASQGVVTATQGRGTAVNPLSEWTSVCAIATVLAARDDGPDPAVQLLDVRRMLEIGATELAATHRSESDLAELHDQLQRMRMAHLSHRIEEFADADITFHEIVLRSSGNILLPALVAQLRPLLVPTRRATSALPVIREHAIAAHAEILAQVAAGSPDGAHAAMRDHMDQTIGDLQRLVRGASPA